MSDKRELRAHFSRLREREKSAEKDDAVTECFLRSPYFAYKSFFVYCSIRSEAATDKLIAALLAAGKRVCVPRIEGGRMLAVPFAPQILRSGDRSASAVMKPRSSA